MKSSRLIAFCAALTIALPIHCYADGDNGNGNDSGTGSGENPPKNENDPIFIPTTPNDPILSKGPKAPSRQYIECVYADGKLSIDFAFSEGFCNLYITDLQTGQTSFYIFDSSDQTEIHIGAVSDGSYLEIKTEKGNMYSGQFKFN